MGISKFTLSFNFRGENHDKGLPKDAYTKAS
jgi:hypothetical protein